jgi:2-polyprenyl-3-methyl-5-hydroxy-6-metoxy-1,4-benzoquinol methylase
MPAFERIKSALRHTDLRLGMMEYRELYDGYWRAADRMGASSFLDAGAIADEIIKACGWGTVLDVGSGMGELVSALCSRGLDARGVDVSSVAVSVAEQKCPGRFREGSILALEQDDNSVDIVVSTDCLEHIAEEDVEAALEELFRVSRKGVYLRIASRPDRDGRWHLTIRDRSWWERQLFKVGFRKHPRYYETIPYESIETERGEFTVVLQKPPAGFIEKYPLAALAAERDLHMDMGREQGSRSDAHMIRYHEAARYIRPGDRVLDAACGLGYGSNILLHNSLASDVLGIDGSDYAIDYATHAYGESGKIRFQKGMLPAVLDDLPENSVDFIASFETLEHLEDPDEFLKACARVLTPGGRILVSVPHDWSDETGTDPNPHHFHLYDWQKLTDQIGKRFLLEQAFAQNANRRKLDGQWVTVGRQWRNVPLQVDGSQPSEWCLVLGMKDPVGASGTPYDERLFPGTVVDSDQPLLDFKGQYRNPWLVRSMISIGPRMSAPSELRHMADRVLATGDHGVADEAAALCVIAYQMLEDGPNDDSFRSFVKSLEKHTEIDLALAAPIAVRWAISLLYVRGLLEMRLGKHDDATVSFQRCANAPFLRYSPLLATKVIESSFRLGVMFFASGSLDTARQWWQFGLDAGHLAARADMSGMNTLPDFVMREKVEVLDLATKCATALSVFHEMASRPAAISRVLVNSRSLIDDLSKQINLQASALNEQTAVMAKQASALDERTSALNEQARALNEQAALISRLSAENSALLKAVHVMETASLQSKEPQVQPRRRRSPSEKLQKWISRKKATIQAMLTNKS